MPLLRLRLSTTAAVRPSRRRILTAALYFLLLVCHRPGPSSAERRPRTLRLTLSRLPNFSSDAFERIVGIYNAGDGSGRLFVVDQTGLVKIYDTVAKRIVDAPFLDIRDKLDDPTGEKGLLGLAFHPDYAANGYLFCNYMSDGETSVVRYRVGDPSDPNAGADPASEVRLLRFPQPYPNHNGGGLAFGPDGYLYVSSGDGGKSFDPRDGALDLRSLLGKILRLDVDGDGAPGGGYAVPPSNPFADGSGGRPEIWAYGVRNAWGMSFDRDGNLFFADVGQLRWEEWNYQRAADVGGQGGKNYGWSYFEGKACVAEKYTQAQCQDYRRRQIDGGNPIVFPRGVYGHESGHCSITGGYRYHGRKLRATLKNMYIYGDLCTGFIWGATSATVTGMGNWIVEPLLDSNLFLTAFGIDEGGELYVANYGRGGNPPAVYQVSRAACFNSKKKFRYRGKKYGCNSLIRKFGLKICKNKIPSTAFERVRFDCPRACKRCKMVNVGVKM